MYSARLLKLRISLIKPRHHILEIRYPQVFSQQGMVERPTLYFSTFIYTWPTRIYLEEDLVRVCRFT